MHEACDCRASERGARIIAFQNCQWISKSLEFTLLITKTKALSYLLWSISGNGNMSFSRQNGVLNVAMNLTKFPIGKLSISSRFFAGNGGWMSISATVFGGQAMISRYAR